MPVIAPFHGPSLRHRSSFLLQLQPIECTCPTEGDASPRCNPGTQKALRRMGMQHDFTSQFDKNFRLFLELMAIKIQEILMISSPYDAFRIEEDGSLASRIINEYSGLNLSKPPRVTRLSSAADALSLLAQRDFDMVIVTPHLDDMDVFSLALEIKKIRPAAPVYLLAHSSRGIYPRPDNVNFEGIDKIFIWSGNADLLLAIIKNAEDHLNAAFDTERGQVPALLYVEDSPLYYSTFLPYMYKEVVKQTQAVLDAGLNEEHRLLKMRARPKILLARNYEEATELYDQYGPFLLSVISDTRFPRGDTMDDAAGISLLSRIRGDFPSLPLLLMSSDSRNGTRAASIPARFIDKNSPRLFSEFHAFFLNNLGFGDFVFKMPDGKEIDRASNLKEIEAKIATIPDESLIYHAENNHFSTWMRARAEIPFATALREVALADFSHMDDVRDFMISSIHTLRKWHQKGVVTKFKANDFDADIMDFVKIGKGSMGGKARGLAFLAELIYKNSQLEREYPRLTIAIPKVLVICTDVFDTFLAINKLDRLDRESQSPEAIRLAFLAATMPEDLVGELQAFLEKVTYPLAVRSSSMLQDTQFDPSLESYETYMIPNDDGDASVRLEQLLIAVRLVYASAFYTKPRKIYRTTIDQPREEGMAVIVQQLVGDHYGDYFYPSLSGVARSYNYYPVSRMKPEEGVADIWMGFAKMNGQGKRSFRFSPRYPAILPQFSTVDDILKNAQKSFYAMRMNDSRKDLWDAEVLKERDINDARDEYPLKLMTSTYVPEEHRLMDTGFIPGPKVVTFSRILKDRATPLPKLLSNLLDLGRRGMGCPVEFEFALTFRPGKEKYCNFYLLQIRPMVAYEDSFEIQIAPDDMDHAFCFSMQSLGNGKRADIADIVYVKPGDFRRERTADIAEEIGRINHDLATAGRPYLLIGPGRWGSSDRWLGIPVQWHNIAGVGAFVELRGSMIEADSSQGYHFFRNITSRGIPYITVTEGSDDFLDWQWIESQETVRDMTFIRHVRCQTPVTLIIDGRKSHCAILKG